MSVFSQLFDEVQTEKATATGDENTHGVAAGLHEMFLTMGIVFLLASLGKYLKTLEIFGW